MPNLLSPEEKKRNASERISRLLVVAGGGIFLILTSGCVLLFSSYLFFSLQARELGRSVGIEKRSPELKRAESIEQSIANLNERIKTFQKNEEQIIHLPFYVEKIKDREPAGVDTTFFRYSRGKKEDPVVIFLRGEASTREEFLNFVEELKKDGFFSEIRSPVSNILKQKEVEFSLQVVLQNENGKK